MKSKFIYDCSGSYLIEVNGVRGKPTLSIRPAYVKVNDKTYIAFSYNFPGLIPGKVFELVEQDTTLHRYKECDLYHPDQKCTHQENKNPDIPLIEDSK